MDVRFFAGAAEAAGATLRTIDVEPTQTVADVVDSLAGNDDHLARILEVSSLLLDGTRVDDRGSAVGDAAQLDVLPPFAGG